MTKQSALDELKRVKSYYEGDVLQKRFSALITGQTGSGKSYLLRTARFPIHIDSFDPGGTKCLRKWIDKGDIVADTSWESEDPYSPKVFAKWMKTVDIRLRTGYFEMFGTYSLDSATTWGDAIMNHQLKAKGDAGGVPRFTRDYHPQKMWMINYIKKLMSLPCDFFLFGHLDRIEDIIGHDSKGVPRKRHKYRFLVTGKAQITLPLLFDELYVLKGKDSPQGVKRVLLTDAQGEYQARSRLRADGKLEAEEEPDIRKILKKIGFSYEDKPKLPKIGGDKSK